MNETVVHTVLRRTYRDSVALMSVAAELERLPGIARAGAVMATPANADILRASHMWPDDVDLGPDDLLIVVRTCDLAAAQTALAAAVEQMLGGLELGSTEAVAVRTLRQAWQVRPESTVVAISTPGDYAAIVAEQALRAGRHVFCFSDNVSIADEIRLKDLAVRRGLLHMGPDCGTAVIDGVGLGFANRLRRGPVGIVAASGTGAQEVACLLDQQGIGISQLIGVGGRDLTDQVAGRMARQAIELLSADPDTRVLLVVSKTPDPGVARQILDTIGKRQAVVCFLGATDEDMGQIAVRGTLFTAAQAVANFLGAPVQQLPPLPAELAARGPVRGSLKGLYTGGTLASEAAVILARYQLAPTRLEIIDLGADIYTAGRPHPMIDPSLRTPYLNAAIDNPDIGLVLVDVVLGDGSASNPAQVLADAIGQQRRSDGPIVIGSICGSEDDPQDVSRQRLIAQAAGIHIAPSNAAAASWAAQLMGGSK